MTAARRALLLLFATLVAAALAASVGSRSDTSSPGARRSSAPESGGVADGNHRVTCDPCQHDLLLHVDDREGLAQMTGRILVTAGAAIALVHPASRQRRPSRSTTDQDRGEA